MTLLASQKRQDDIRSDGHGEAKMLYQFLKSNSQLLGLLLYYHWNASGENFLPFHNLTDQQYKNVFSFMDTWAERIRALGFKVFPPFCEQSFDNLDDNIASACNVLARQHRRLASFAQELAENCESLNDSATADILNERSRFHEKSAWIFESCLGHKA